MSFVIHPSAVIAPTARIDVKEGYIGAGTIVQAHAVIQGTRVEIGRRSFIDEYAVVGGGSCFDEDAFLRAGDFLHLGQFSHVNIARGVTIGDEVAIGQNSKVYTHGAYQNPLVGGAAPSWGPVEIGDNSWIMVHCVLTPGTKIEQGRVVKSLSTSMDRERAPFYTMENPESRCEWVIKDVVHQIRHQRGLKTEEGMIYEKPFAVLPDKLRLSVEFRCNEGNNVIVERHTFDALKKQVEMTTKIEKQGAKIKDSVDRIEVLRIVRDQLRRNGLRFPFELISDNSITTGSPYRWQRWQDSEVQFNFISEEIDLERILKTQ